MRKYSRGSYLLGGLSMALFVVFGASHVWATTTNSPNFEASETEFGAGASLNSCSGQYCAQATIGTIGGETSSQNFTANFSQFADDDEEPKLELMIEPGESNLGKLDMDRTATRTMLLHVKSHFAGGYTVQVVGKPPVYEGYSLATPISPIASQKGTEQFALNIVANTEPQVGSNPQATPDDSNTVSGVIKPDYALPNMFKYINGDIVAQTISQSSQIRYTVSMIVNVSGDTPAGHYTGDFSAIVTPVF